MHDYGAQQADSLTEIIIETNPKRIQYFKLSLLSNLEYKVHNKQQYPIQFSTITIITVVSRGSLNSRDTTVSVSHRCVSKCLPKNQK